MPAIDATGSVRSAVGLLRLALDGSGSALVIGADIRGGLPGSGDEAAGGDGASRAAGRLRSGRPGPRRIPRRGQRDGRVRRPVAHPRRHPVEAVGRTSSARTSTSPRAARRGPTRSRPPA
ncbi:hypothetical protein ACU686_04470 [Yinghuangia aomiensis]